MDAPGRLGADWLLSLSTRRYDLHHDATPGPSQPRPPRATTEERIAAPTTAQPSILSPARADGPAQRALRRPGARDRGGEVDGRGRSPRAYPVDHYTTTVANAGTAERAADRDRGIYCRLYVVLDLFSRYTVG